MFKNPNSNAEFVWDLEQIIISLAHYFVAVFWLNLFQILFWQSSAYTCWNLWWTHMMTMFCRLGRNKTCIISATVLSSKAMQNEVLWLHFHNKPSIASTVLLTDWNTMLPQHNRQCSHENQWRALVTQMHDCCCTCSNNRLWQCNGTASKQIVPDYAHGAEL